MRNISLDEMKAIAQAKAKAVNMVYDPEEVIGEYAHYLSCLLDDDEQETIGGLILDNRTSMTRYWDLYSNEQKVQVEALDRILFEKRDFVSYMMPHPSFPDKAMWWWHLHDPEVVAAVKDLLGL